MNWLATRKAIREVKKMNPVEWLEKGYDEVRLYAQMLHAGNYFADAGVAGRVYQAQFHPTHASGMASIKPDHEGRTRDGQCIWCEGSELIVIE